MLFVCLVSIVISFLILILLLFQKENQSFFNNTEFPKVSVLLAVRNEEKNIIDCLKALSKQTYTNFEVWIGNDDSTDNTKKMIQHFIQQYPHFHLLEITIQLGNAKGKANVLAHLANQASGDFLAITDADIIVPNTWLETFVNHLDEETGIISGVTTIIQNGFFAKMQHLDWLFSFLMIKYLSDKKIPVTALGNNLFVKKEAYLETGGYENLPFSVTEDFQLFHEIVKNKWKFKHLFLKGIKAESKPIFTFYNLLQQRKRWTVGAMQLPFWIKFLLLNQLLYFVSISFLFIDYPMISLMIFIVKILMQIVHLNKKVNELNTKINYLLVVVYEFYQVILGISLLLFYLLPIKVNWKNRTY